MRFHWPYYELISGLLYVRRLSTAGLVLAFEKAPRFESIAAAEDWLVANDLRGNVRDTSPWGTVHKGVAT